MSSRQRQRSESRSQVGYTNRKLDMAQLTAVTRMATDNLALIERRAGVFIGSRTGGKQSGISSHQEWEWQN